MLLSPTHSEPQAGEHGVSFPMPSADGAPVAVWVTLEAAMDIAPQGRPLQNVSAYRGLFEAIASDKFDAANAGFPRGLISTEKRAARPRAEPQVTIGQGGAPYGKSDHGTGGTWSDFVRKGVRPFSG